MLFGCAHQKCPWGANPWMAINSGLVQYRESRSLRYHGAVT